MKFTRNPILLASAVSSIVGLILIYIAATTIAPTKTVISEIDSSLVGRAVTISGYIENIRSSQGNVFITLTDNTTTILVPLFASYIKSTKIDTKNMEAGDRLTVTGVVDQYRNELEIIPRKLGDVVVG